MIDKINENLTLVNAFDTQSKEEVEAFRIKYLGKKGILNDFFAAFKEVPPKPTNSSLVKGSLLKKELILTSNFLNKFIFTVTETTPK